jgi:hypothetical protein
MFKRLFFAMLGLGAGILLGMWAIRKAEEAQRKLSPEHLANTAGARATSARDRIALALAEGKRAATAKEAELRAVYRVREVPGSPGIPPGAPPGPIAPNPAPTIE